MACLCDRMPRRALGIGEGPLSSPTMCEVSGSRRLERLHASPVNTQLKAHVLPRMH